MIKCKQNVDISGTAASSSHELRLSDSAMNRIINRICYYINISLRYAQKKAESE